MLFSKPCRFVLYSTYLLTAFANADTIQGVQQRKLVASATVELGTAGNYAILSQTGITNVVDSVITGNIAVTPIATTAMTGFTFTTADEGNAWKSSQVVGLAYGVGDTQATTDTLAIAGSDMMTAYNDAFGRTSDTVRTAFGELGGKRLVSTSTDGSNGVYVLAAAVSINSDVTFVGTSEDIFIMKIPGTLMIAGNMRVLLEGGVQAKNIFWQVSGAVTVNVGAHMEGILLAATSVVFMTNSSLNGRILAQTAVTLQVVTIDSTVSVIEPISPVTNPSTPVTPTEPTELEARWALENPITQYVAADNKFTMTYNEASSENLNANLRATFFDGNCQNPVADINGDTPVAFALTLGMGITAVLTEAMPEPIMNALSPTKPVLEFKVDTLTLANTPAIYEVVDQALIDSPLKPYSADDMGKGVMTMCARFSLGYTEGNDYQEVNFIESVITIKYDLTAGFSVDAFAVEAKDKDAATGVKDSYQVIAYLCDASTVSTASVSDGTETGFLYEVPARITGFEPLLNGLPNLSGSAFQQGSLVTVCVTPDALTIADGIVMGAITDFTWKRGATRQAAVETNAAGDFVAALNGLSALSCNAQDVYCSFASILFADFYFSAGTVAGDGNANMEFKINARRLKGGVEGERRQLQEAAAASPFDVSVGVTELDDGPGALKTAGGASMGFTALASAIALVSAALLA